MKPIYLKPSYQNYVWGGTRIPSYFSRDLCPNIYAESWEVSDRPEGMSIIGNGPLLGTKFREWLDQQKMVRSDSSLKPFPLLVKVIDAAQHLSVQIHPDEASAIRLCSEPKSEMWIALEESVVYAGLKKGVTQAQFLKALEESNLEDLLVQFHLAKGDSLYIPAGQVHAICAGSFLLEIQQNSNTTYRLYDWGRKGRQLHLTEGLSCIDWENEKPLKIEPIHRGVSNPYFRVEYLDVSSQIEIDAFEKGYRILFCMSGKGILGDEIISKGMTYLIPASGKAVSINGCCQLLVIEPL